MEKNQKLQQILELRDEALKVYDILRLEKSMKYENFKLAEKHRDKLTELLCLEADGYLPVFATEDCFVYPESRTQIETNIKEIEHKTRKVEGKLEFTHQGIISTYGNLSFFLVRDINQVPCIFVENKLPKSVYEYYPDCYSLEDPTITKYFWAGVYYIKKGQLLGMATMNDEDILTENEILGRRRTLSRAIHELD